MGEKSIFVVMYFDGKEEDGMIARYEGDPGGIDELHETLQKTGGHVDVVVDIVFGFVMFWDHKLNKLFGSRVIQLPSIDPTTGRTTQPDEETKQ